MQNWKASQFKKTDAKKLKAQQLVEKAYERTTSKAGQDLRFMGNMGTRRDLIQLSKKYRSKFRKYL